MKKIFNKLNQFFDGKWNIAVLDLERGRWVNEAISRNIDYFKAENANGRHILMKPFNETECLKSMFLWKEITGQDSSDPGAHPNGRWGRCPGFRNRKEIHRNSKKSIPTM
jgi:hypothetical protein